MWLVQLNNPAILCLLICIGFGLTLQEDWKADTDEADDSDFFDYHLSKLLKEINLEQEAEAEEIPDSIKTKTPKPPKSQTLEPDAEMLPAHYTGVKSPGVDHMELVMADAKMENSDGDIYMIAVKNKKIPKSKKATSAQKKSGKRPKGVVEHSESRNVKTVRNYVYRDVFGKEGSSEEATEGKRGNDKDKN